MDIYKFEWININNSKIKTVNIKKDNPSADIAVYYLSKEIYDAKHTGVEILKVIHGYGSHGVGGEIKKAVAKYLLDAQRKKEIKFFVKGEEWSSCNEKVLFLQEKYPSLLIDEDVKNINSGITIIYLKDEKSFL